MPIPIPSIQEITDRAYANLKRETTIAANIDSSIIGLLIKLTAAELDLVWKFVDEKAKQTDITTATGEALDNIGFVFNVPRKAAKQASTLGFTRSVRFSNLSNVSLTLPSGVRVWKASDPQAAFFTTEGATLAPGQSTEVHVTASDIGEFYNVGIGQLNKHNYPNTNVIVTNILPVLNGSASESDASYRQRILQDIRRRDVVNVDTCDALLRAVPGVKDVFILNFYRGYGTFDAIIIPYSVDSTSSIVSQCNSLLSRSLPIGINFSVRGPKYRQIDIKVTLKFDPATGNRKDSIREAIRAQLSARIDNLPVEDGTGIGTFNAKQIAATALQADNAILDAFTSIGLDGTPISNEGEIRLAVGDRLVIRSLDIQ